MTTDADAAAALVDAVPTWRASAGRIAWHGWLLGALGGGLTVSTSGLAAWLWSSSPEMPGAAGSLIVGLVACFLAGAPIGGVGGLWGAAIVLALRGRHPAPRRTARVARIVASSALLAVGIVTIVVLDVASALANLGGPAAGVVTLVLGALATVRILLLAHAVGEGVRPAPAADSPAPEPFVLGAALGPIATSAAPIIAFATGDGDAATLLSTGSGFLALFTLGVGPLVGMGFAAVVGWPWDGSDERPRTRAVRVAAVVALQVIAAGLLAVLATAMLVGELAMPGAVAAGVLILAVQLALLVAAWRSHARHAEDLSRSR